jgi:probable phosphoglycerate mutase
VPERLLHLVRHGEASGDDDDAPLTPLGERQSAAAAARLAALTVDGVFHSPSCRAARTAEIIADQLPGITPTPSPLVGDLIPSNPNRSDVPAIFGQFLDRLDDEQLARGPDLARAALERFAGEPAADGIDVIVTHAFVVGWFVTDALDAPPWRWMTLNVSNGSLTSIRYRTGRPAALVAFNDTGHLAEVR